MLFAVLLHENSVSGLMINFKISVNIWKLLVMDLIKIGDGVCGFLFVSSVVIVSISLSLSFVVK